MVDETCTVQYDRNINTSGFWGWEGGTIDPCPPPPPFNTQHISSSKKCPLSDFWLKRHLKIWLPRPFILVVTFFVHVIINIITILVIIIIFLFFFSLLLLFFFLKEPHAKSLIRSSYTNDYNLQCVSTMWIWPLLE